MNLWNIYPTDQYAWIVLFIIMSGALLRGINIIRQASPAQKINVSYQIFLRILFVILLLVLSFLPNLLAVGNVVQYRTCIALTPMVLVVLLWAIDQWGQLLPKSLGNKVFTGILLGGCLAGGFLTHYVVKHYRVIPSQMELQYVKKILQEHDLSEYYKIHFIQPEWSARYRYDEFMTPSTSMDFNLWFMVRCVLKELKIETQAVPNTPSVLRIANAQLNPNSDYNFHYFLIETSRKDEEINIDEKTILIDMNKLHLIKKHPI